MFKYCEFIIKSAKEKKMLTVLIACMFAFEHFDAFRKTYSRRELMR